jgi:hypothetical protein
MAELPNWKQGASDWDPGPGPKKSDTRADQLMATEAEDAKDTVTGTNVLKQWEGGSGKPPTPYGSAGKKF